MLGIANEFKQNKQTPPKTLHRVQAHSRSSEFLPKLGLGVPGVCGEVVGAGGSSVLTVNHSSSAGLIQSCLLSADELEVLGGMEGTWHGNGNCCLGVRAEPDKRITMMVNLWCNLFAAGFHLKVNIDKSWSSLISWLPV